MSFDKIKVMKTAERFLSQGKLRLAISEYNKVIEHNPNDFSTLNIIGDLCVKNSDTNEAVECFTRVAEHYYDQGFANKAIAVYSKIARLQPESIGIAARLAQLYKVRGSYAEAREQFTKLAVALQQNGKKVEALEVWKQIAELDPNNTEVYLTIGKSCLQENLKDEAVDAFAEAGLRFNSQKKFEEAVSAFDKALYIQTNNLKTLRGMVAAKISLGCADEAAATLEKVLVNNPYDREILLLLTDCYLDMNAPSKAEDAVVQLVQQDPSNFPKFLEIAEVYLKENDLESTVRALSISFEYLLGSGLSEEFLGLLNEVLARNPEFIDGLRLLVKYHSWHRHPAEIRIALERVVEAARLTESVEDERFALGQLAAISPLQTEFTERLDELRSKHGFEETEVPAENVGPVPEFESFTTLNSDEDLVPVHGEIIDKVAQFNGDSASADDPGAATGFEFFGDDDGSIGIADFSDLNETVDASLEEAITPEDMRLQKEIESVEFYINQGYNDLALKCLDALNEEFGQNPKFIEMRCNILGVDILQHETAETVQPEPIAVFEETVMEAGDTVETDLGNSAMVDEVMSPAVNVFEQFRSELGLEEPEEISESDYSTRYQTAIAYKEMGLMEDSIKEFQEAINMVQINDGTRRYFECANLLGHCFMMKGMPNLAQTWFKRALDTANLHDEEIQALNYELANAYEASGEREQAFKYFEQVYALDVDYRDIGQRIQNLKENYTSSMIN